MTGFGEPHGRRRKPGDHDQQPAVELTDEERRRFEQLTSSAWSKRNATRQAWWWAGGAIAGAVAMFATLGRSPVAVPFAGYLVTVVCAAELGRIGAWSRWWSRIKERLGLEPSS